MNLKASQPGRIPSSNAKLCTVLPKIIAFWRIAVGCAEQCGVSASQHQELIFKQNVYLCHPERRARECAPQVEGPREFFFCPYRIREFSQHLACSWPDISSSFS
jgi:hypothetical protein